MIRALIITLAIVAPLGAIGLWQWSGGRVASAKQMMVTVVEHDPLWGDQSKVVAQAGPVFGWYVGLDVVIAVCVVSLIVIGVVMLQKRFRKAKLIPG